MEQILLQCFKRIIFGNKEDVLRSVFVLLRYRAFLVTEDGEATEGSVRGLQNFELICRWYTLEPRYVSQQSPAVFDGP